MTVGIRWRSTRSRVSIVIVVVGGGHVGSIGGRTDTADAIVMVIVVAFGGGRR